MSEAHVMAVPSPAQGHVTPFMELSRELAKQGIKVTFVNSDFTQKLIMEALGDKAALGNNIQLVSISDGLEVEDRWNAEKVAKSMDEVMPEKLEMLIDEINNADRIKITCVVADQTFGWALEVAKKMGIRSVAFWPASASVLALQLNIQKLIDDGVIDSDGTPVKDETIQLAPRMPAMRTTEFTWVHQGDRTRTKIFFGWAKRTKESPKVADWSICNTSYDLEPAALAYAPEITPIGPLLASNHVVSFFPEDSTCLNWLDQQEVNSVLYAAFGSFTLFDHTQLQELAHGLELSNKPFLLVVRSDVKIDERNCAFLKEFEERVPPHVGKVVQWAPQRKVLSHPSVACFMSHCGWNSAMEGIIRGVPFLCWPYFADQFLNETLICDVWKVGLRLDKNGGVVTREEITCKIKQLLHDEKFKIRVLELKTLTINNIKEGGSSNKNLNNFVEWIKDVNQ